MQKTALIFNPNGIIGTQLMLKFKRGGFRCIPMATDFALSKRDEKKLRRLFYKQEPINLVLNNGLSSNQASYRQIIDIAAPIMAQQKNNATILNLATLNFKADEDFCSKSLIEKIRQETLESQKYCNDHLRIYSLTPLAPPLGPFAWDENSNDYEIGKIVRVSHLLATMKPSKNLKYAV